MLAVDVRSLAIINLEPEEPRQARSYANDRLLSGYYLAWLTIVSETSCISAFVADRVPNVVVLN